MFAVSWPWHIYLGAGTYEPSSKNKLPITTHRWTNYQPLKLLKSSKGPVDVTPSIQSSPSLSNGMAQLPQSRHFYAIRRLNADGSLMCREVQSGRTVFT